MRTLDTSRTSKKNADSCRERSSCRGEPVTSIYFAPTLEIALILIVCFPPSCVYYIVELVLAVTGDNAFAAFQAAM